MSNYQFHTHTFDANGIKTIANTSDFRHFIISVHADASATATVRLKGSPLLDVIDFSAATSSTNDWDYVALRELQTANLIAGATGVAISAATHHKLYEVEANGLSNIAVDVSGLTGSVTVNVFLRND